MVNIRDTHYDVIIVGAGMVGTTVACLLAQIADKQGSSALKIGLIESRSAPPFDSNQFDPRVAALTEKTRALLERCSVWEDIQAKRVAPYTAMQVWDAEGTGQINFNCRDVHLPNLGHIVEASAITSSLMARVEPLPNIDIYCPASVEHYQLEEDAVILGLHNQNSISAALLIAADGANSSVRQQFQFATREWDYQQQAIVTTITTERPNQQTAWQRFMPTGPLALLPLNDDGNLHRCSIVWSQDTEEAERLMALGDEDFCEQLSIANEHCLGRVTAVDKRFLIPLRQRHAIDYVKPRVALIGDAAHSIHPLAGQGVNLGFADVQVLVEEIQRAFSRGIDLGELSVLKRYQRRRKPENLAAMATMEGFKRLFGSNSSALRLMRNRGMLGVDQIVPLKNQLIKKAMGL
jgi:2-octaprenylphenol hydroxylase